MVVTGLALREIHQVVEGAISNTWLSSYPAFYVKPAERRLYCMWRTTDVMVNTTALAAFHRMDASIHGENMPVHLDYGSW